MLHFGRLTLESARCSDSDGEMPKLLPGQMFISSYMLPTKPVSDFAADEGAAEGMGFDFSLAEPEISEPETETEIFEPSARSDFAADEEAAGVMGLNFSLAEPEISERPEVADMFEPSAPQSDFAADEEAAEVMGLEFSLAEPEMPEGPEMGEVAEVAQESVGDFAADEAVAESMGLGFSLTEPSATPTATPSATPSAVPSDVVEDTDTPFRRPKRSMTQLEATPMKKQRTVEAEVEVGQKGVKDTASGNPLELITVASI